MPRQFAMVRFVLGIVACAAVGFALHPESASAQCVTPEPAPWPTQVQFVPANPMPGQPIQMRLGPLSSIRILGATAVQNGQDIVVGGDSFLFGGVPPPLAISEIELGSFAAGSYLVRLQLRHDGAACPEMTFPLLVGASPSLPVPALGDRAGQLGLGAGLLLAAAWAGQQRRRRTRS